MHHPIYYPVKSKTNGYIDYNEVEKILTIEDLYQENQELKKQLSNDHQIKNQQKEFIEWLEWKAKKYTPNLRVDELDEYGNRIAQYINAEVYEIPPVDVVKEILSKYKEIVGGNNDQ